MVGSSDDVDAVLVVDVVVLIGVLVEVLVDVLAFLLDLAAFLEE